MTNDPSPLAPPKASAKQPWQAHVLIGVLALGLLWFTLAPSVFRVATTVGVSGEAEVLQARVENLETRLHSLESKMDAAGSAAPVPIAAASDSNAAAGLAHVQGDMAALSSAMAALQAEVKATGATATEARETSTALVASVVAFLQLRDVTSSGRSFVEELATMRDTAKSDAVLLNALSKLEPYAAVGASTLSALHEELLQRQPAVAVAVAKGSAQNWWQRLVAELQGLITVRPVHGGEGDALAGLETALGKGNADEAMQVFKDLPSDAQKNLADWQKRLEARQNIDDNLRDIARHFTSLSQAKNP